MYRLVTFTLASFGLSILLTEDSTQDSCYEIWGNCANSFRAALIELQRGPAYAVLEMWGCWWAGHLSAIIVHTLSFSVLQLIFNLFPIGKRDFFSSPKHPDWLRGQSSLLFNGQPGSFMEIKQQLGHEFDQSLPCNGKVSNERSYTSFPSCMSWVDRYNFIN